MCFPSLIQASHKKAMMWGRPCVLSKGEQKGSVGRRKGDEDVIRKYIKTE